MAGTTKKNVTTNVAEEEVQELNLDAKVTVKSIAGWFTGFSRIVDGYGDVTITPNGSVRLSRNEIIAQIQSGNRLFNGADDVGSHATLIIEDKPTRIEVGFETVDSEQEVFSDAKVIELFKITAQKTFENKFVDLIRTRAEKYAVMQAISKHGFNDYRKIKFAENYTGFKLDRF